MAIKQKNHIQFHISPSSVWRNIVDDPNNANTTAGQGSYYDIYVNTREWIQKGIMIINPSLKKPP